jgi:prepilin-type N-terminal cleavage/methylation domain-containing protein
MQTFSVSPSLLSGRAPAGRACRRGFTLVELLVALAIGLSVSMAAFLLAKNATRVFQNEARITSTQLAVTLGLNRIAADVQRAAFMSSPNMQPTVKPFNCKPEDEQYYAAPTNVDPLYRGDDKANWPKALQRLAGLTIEKHDPADGDLTQSTDNGFDPERITIGASLHTTEQFPATVPDYGVGGNLDVLLQLNSGPLERTLATLQQQGSGLADLFQEGRLLRIESADVGRFQYGVIIGVDVTGTPPSQVRIRLATLPKIHRQSEKLGGIGGLGVGILVNPVSRIRYDIRSLAGHVRYGALVTPVTPAMTGDDGRTELIRVELDADDKEIPDTLELIAEYAVDLRFGITVRTKEAVPTIKKFPIVEPTDPEILTRAGLPGVATAQPETIRSVQIRLATRSRAPDRMTDLGGIEDAADGRRYRFKLPNIKSETTFARLRTHYADVALTNQAGVEW